MRIFGSVIYIFDREPKKPHRNVWACLAKMNDSAVDREKTLLGGGNMKIAFLITFLGCILLLDQTRYVIAAENSATKKEISDIVNSLIKDGKIQSTCVEAQPKQSKIVDVTLIRLTKGKKYQFLVKGRPPCAFGARDPMWYVYENSTGKYRLIADLGAAGNVDLSNDTTHGWRDLICNYTYEAGTRLAANVFKFDGTIYKYSHTVERGKAPGL
jgi:hypothetical protein